MFWLWMTTAALAGNVYLNGTYIDPLSVAGLEMEKVNVNVDAQGNIHIDAPGYKVEVMSPPPPASYGAPQPGANNTGTQAAYAAPAQPYAAPPAQPYAAPPAQPYGAPPPQPYAAPPPQPVAAAPGLLPNGISKATWWMVTEDNGSGGHQIEVYINNQLAKSLRSGEGQQIIDVGAFLRGGSNDVVVKSNSAGASGGTLYVYIGSGSDRSGTVVMDEPQVQFGVGSSRAGAYQREYQVKVN